MWTRLLAVGVLAYALPSHAEVIHACINNASGTIKIVAESAVCPSGWIRTSLSTTEPASTDVYVARRGEVQLVPGPVPYIDVARLDLPAGAYLMHATVWFGFGAAQLECRIVSNVSGFIVAQAVTRTLDTGISDSLSMVGRIKLEAPESLPMQCRAGPSGEAILVDLQLIAQAVGTIHQQ